MTKQKRSSEIFAYINPKILSETESEIFFENRGKSETGGKCIIASGGMDAPALVKGYSLASPCATFL